MPRCSVRPLHSKDLCPFLTFAVQIEKKCVILLVYHEGSQAIMTKGKAYNEDFLLLCFILPPVMPEMMTENMSCKASLIMVCKVPITKYGHSVLFNSII